jgi:hypothetical protein
METMPTTTFSSSIDLGPFDVASLNLSLTTKGPCAARTPHADDNDNGRAHRQADYVGDTPFDDGVTRRY